MVIKPAFCHLRNWEFLVDSTKDCTVELPGHCYFLPICMFLGGGRDMGGWRKRRLSIVLVGFPSNDSPGLKTMAYEGSFILVRWGSPVQSPSPSSPLSLQP